MSAAFMSQYNSLPSDAYENKFKTSKLEEQYR